jgi:hypothetical protein
MPRLTPAIAALLVILVGARPAIGGAQSASVPGTLAGTWVYDGSIAGAVRIVEAAFEPGISTFPELFQGFARSRLRASMAPPSRVVVALSGAAHLRVTLASSERTTVVDGDLGSPATVSDAEGDPRVVPRLRGGWLEIGYEGEGSHLEQLLSTEPDGARMHLDFNVVSPQLPAPVRYRLEYVHPPS